MLRSVFDASLTTFCAASSQFFGDSDITSITLTIFAMDVILLFLMIEEDCAFGSFEFLRSDFSRRPVYAPRASIHCTAKRVTWRAFLRFNFSLIWARCVSTVFGLK